MLKLLSLLCCLAFVSAQGTLDNNETNGTTPESSTSCTVAGVTWSEGFKYLVGRAGVFPSIYAKCENGVATCYRQTPIRDSERESFDCTEKEIHNARRQLGIYVPKKDNVWPKGVVCYGYGVQFNAEQRGVFSKAMDEFHQKTSVRFITLDECKSQYGSDTEVCDGCTHDFKFVQEKDACYATLGYIPKTNSILNFGQGCFTGGGHSTAVHELGHVTGLIHEHTHQDREVVVLPDEILVGPDNYQKSYKDAITPYDRMSVMHYGRYTGLCVPKDTSKKFCDVFVEQGQDCAVPKKSDCDDSQDKTFGTSPGLAESDIATLAKMYGGSTKAPSTPTPTTAPTPAPTPKPPTPPPQTQGPPTQRPPTQRPTKKPESQVDDIRQVNKVKPTGPVETSAPTTAPPSPAPTPSPQTPPPTTDVPKSTPPASSDSDSFDTLNILGTKYKIVRGDDGAIHLKPEDPSKKEIVLPKSTTKAKANPAAETTANANSVKQSA